MGFHRKSGLCRGWRQDAAWGTGKITRQHVKTSGYGSLLCKVEVKRRVCTKSYRPHVGYLGYCVTFYFYVISNLWTSYWKKEQVYT